MPPSIFVQKMYGDEALCVALKNINIKLQIKINRLALGRLVFPENANSENFAEAFFYPSLLTVLKIMCV